MCPRLAGPCLIKEPIASPTSWSPPGEADANASNVLFWSLLLCVTYRGKIDELNAYAKDVLQEESAAEEGRSAWSPPKERWPRGGKYQVSKIFEPLAHAHKGVAWPEEVLDQVATAMQAWRGEGAVANLTGALLRNYISTPPLAVRARSKDPPPPRYRSWAVVRVARLLFTKGSKLRNLLALAPDSEAAKPEHLVLAEQAVRIRELEAELKEKEKAARRLQDAWRQAAGRLKEKNTAVTAARRDERSKLHGERMSYRKEEQERADKRAEKRKEHELQTARRLKNQALARARAADADTEKVQRKLSKLEKEVADTDTAAVELSDGEMDESSDEEEIPRRNKRRDEKGRFESLPEWIRVLVWAQLARRVPPSAINANITDVLRAMGEEVPPLPSERELKRMRNEVTVAAESLAAFRVALAKRIISFGFDESTKFGLGLLASNTQIEPHDAPGTSVDVVLRGATLTAGGTSEQVAKSVDAKIFSHSRRLLAGWKAEHETKFGKNSWRTDGGPDPSQIGIHRLAEETVIMGDNCNGERKSKHLVATAAMAAKRLEIGNEKWEAMSEEERENVCRSYIGDCHDHLRNTIVKGMTTAATDFLKDSLEDSLSQFSSYDRMSVDCNDLIYSCWKELHPGGAYAKGKGRESKAWREKVYPSAMFIPIYNAHGGRQDAAFDGSHSLFVNWDINTDFLNGLVNVPRADNKLELFLWRLHGCNEMRAYARVNTLWKLNITDAMRWLSGKADELKDWSLVSADRVLELAEEYFEAVAADGSKLLDPTLDPFTEIAASQPAFAAWRKERATQKMTSPDGKTTHRIYTDSLAEAQSATSVGNVQATPTTIKLAEIMANGALKIMHDTKRAIAEKLTSQDGECAPAKRQKMHKATIGAHVNNSRCESIFGSYDYVGHIFRGASAAILGGLAQCMRNCPFERAPNVASDRRKRKAGAPAPVATADGYYYRLPSDRLRQSLVAFTRKEAIAARKLERDDLAAQDAAHLERREERVIALLNKAVDDYAYSKELFRAWKGYVSKDGTPMPSQAAKTTAEVDRYLNGKPESQQLEYLRKQIEIRVIGLGWSQYATRWSSNKDARIGTVAHLRELLKEIQVEEATQRRLKQLPDEAALPQQIRRNL